MRRAVSASPLLAAIACLGVFLVAPAMAQDETWELLKPDVFGDVAIAADSPLLEMTAPMRAEDPAMVPIDIAVSLPEGDDRTIAALTLIVDENPAPVAATFRFGDERDELRLSTRLRVNSYSHIRAIAELSDGALHMTSRFVMASGGCSAPALKDADQAMARLGELRFRAIAGDADAGPMSQAQLMIRHPNYSGLQMNQLTRLYIPAKFVNSIRVMQGEEMVFEMEGGISLSEDPSIRFNYDGDGPLTVEAGDTDGRVFTGVLEGAAPQG